MATAAGQAKAQALNSKLEGEARVAIDDIDKQYIRKIARGFHSCSLGCYDKIGSGSSDQLEACVNQCQMPQRQASALVQQEVGNYQNRLQRAMQECQDKARDQMKPGYENDAKMMSKVEGVLLACISSTVDEYIGKLKPMKDRIALQLKKQS